jgi:F0F1-type ATP synthase epsilon subunit
MANKTATFWRYEGNHPSGRDHERHDPHGFGLQAIAMVAYEQREGVKVQRLGTAEIAGQTLKVTAPVAVWEDAVSRVKAAKLENDAEKAEMEEEQERYEQLMAEQEEWEDEQEESEEEEDWESGEE